MYTQVKNNKKMITMTRDSTVHIREKGVVYWNIYVKRNSKYIIKIDYGQKGENGYNIVHLYMI